VTREAVVVRLTGPGAAVIRVTRGSMCGEQCGTCGGCLHPNETIETAAVNEIGAHPGDRVIIRSSSVEALKVAALIYIVPIVLFVAGYFIHPLAGAVGLIAGFFCAFAVNRRAAKSGSMKPVICGWAGGDEL
jgi:sigma-E factor negative regulatory protein RseC